ncbi:hypothetical protein FJR11_06500 [Anabaena sp. UHCC 0187]|uniref:hypothetical protein n=1 Tax=Anabaena sp. UHCC 0187 TaxID=2590018 RepID=UPI0014478CAB|nr:hypothetical protein [Anabaena sp. UHCC 0187]MDP5018786.1 hypothetical protein [Dolichospermum sp.]MTJ12248.1 hypothetical protein [Anabaena sp. UHCC 0187]
MIYNLNLGKALKVSSLSVILAANLGIIALAPHASVQAAPVSSVGKSVTFTCNDTEATIKAKNGPKVTVGQTSIYIGYQQVTSLNQDPRIVRFDNGVKKWCRSDYETTSDDGRGYGLLWDGSGTLYGVFSSTGTQTGADFRRFATGRWLSSYGSGGGAKVSVIARINPINGDVNYATFLSAILSSGKSNSLTVTGLSWNGTNLTVKADSWWSPRRPDKKAMTCTPGSVSPFKYTSVFKGDLKTVSSASAANCK